MKFLDLTLTTPAENLALDEALLDAAEDGQGSEVLRFWEPVQHFVVVGYANKTSLEVNEAVCAELKIPVLRRCSGGGTVLQGPGCLNYSVILQIEKRPLLATIPQTNSFVMERQAEALRSLLGENVKVCGHTDLALGNLKFSGNAQRRKRRHLIFHGTFLLNFDLELIQRVLRMPSRQPDYRSDRSHREFLTNVKLSSALVKRALTKIWEAEDELKRAPSMELLLEKYSSGKWNFRSEGGT